jgi:hypothetical protein
MFFLEPLLLVACLASPAPAWQGAPQAPEAADEYVVARAGDTELRWKELDELLLLRHGMSTEGREALKHLSETRLVEVAAREAGVAIAEKDLDARVQQLEQQMLAKSGQTLDQQLAGARITRLEFRYFLGVSMQQQELTRRALGLKPGSEVSEDQARLWVQEAFTERQYAEFAPPWADGIVARATGFQVSVQDYVYYLRRRVQPEELRQDCFQFLLCRRVRARMPDVAQAKVDEYVQKEIERRRRETASDPKYKGMPYERILQAQGLSLEALARDPGVIASALSKLWVDRAYDAETLKRTYQEAREHYDGRFGEAIDVSLLSLNAGQFKNAFVTRTFAEAEAELKRIAAGLKNLDDFQKAAKASSEDAVTKESGGALGWVSAGNAGGFPEIRAQVKQRLAAVPTPAQLAGEGLVGPLRTSTGCVLLWLGPRRPAPTWDIMARYVQLELRAHFIDEVLPRESVSYNLGNQ